MYEKYLSITSMFLIPRKKRLILFDIYLVYFGLSVPFTSCLYYRPFTVSGKITPFMYLVCMVNSPVLVSLIYHSYPVFLVVMGVGAGFVIFVVV